MAGRGYTFTASMEQDEDGRWNAWLNEIPWCITFGDTEEDAMRELQDAAYAVVASTRSVRAGGVCGCGDSFVVVEDSSLRSE